MSMSPEASKALDYIDRLIADQKKVILKGGLDGGAQITRIEEYRAGVMLVRNMERIRENTATIFEGDEPSEESVLIPEG